MMYLGIVVLFAFNVLETQPPHYGNPVPFPLPILVLSLKGKQRPLVLGERCPPVLGGKMPFDAGKFLFFAITSPPFSLMMNTLFFGLGYRELFPKLSIFPAFHLCFFIHLSWPFPELCLSSLLLTFQSAIILISKI